VNQSALAAFAALAPDAVLEASESIGLEPSGRLLALNSYENRVYQLADVQGALWVLKFYRPARWTDAQILEEHGFTAELHARDLAVAAALQRDGATLFRYRDYRFAAYPYLGGRAPELDRGDELELLGRSLGRMHAVGASRCFRERPTLTVERLGRAARAAVLASGRIASELRDRYADVSERLVARVAAEFESIGPTSAIRLHGDCHPGNILWRETGPLFVDFDDCMTGPRVQDLWMFLSGAPHEQQAAWEHLMRGYMQFGDIEPLELRLVEPLRALRMIHYAGWLAQRWADPAFPRAFPWFAEPRFWERHLNDLLEQHAAIDDPPILAR
jgi:Ser/Thr protein kinase RdoA (MazF antagonist)